jgi:filamentous hemagglutinin
MGAGGSSASSAGIRFPKNPSQSKHIFRQKGGHLTVDTFANRKIFLDVANDRRNYQGADKYGVGWYSKTNSDGSQIWVKVKNNVICDAGVNKTPIVWDRETGYSKNPFRR